MTELATHCSLLNKLSSILQVASNVLHQPFPFFLVEHMEPKIGHLHLKHSTTVTAELTVLAHIMLR